MDFSEAMEWIAKIFEGVGVAIIALGGIAALFRALVDKIDGKPYFEYAKRQFGRPLLLGLEVLVAADIIETVTVDRSLESVGELGLLVLVRTFLSFALGSSSRACCRGGGQRSKRGAPRLSSATTRPVRLASMLRS